MFEHFGGGDRGRYAVVQPVTWGGCEGRGHKTADRACRVGGELAQVTGNLAFGTGGWLDWLPQETILFDASALARRTTIDLVGNAGCLGLWLRARDGRTVADLTNAGGHVIAADQCMSGIPEMIHSIQVEATFPNDTNLVTIHRPVS